MDTEQVHYKKQVAETDKAILFLIEDDEVWIPKSVIEDDDCMGTIEVATWFCDREGLA